MNHELSREALEQFPLMTGRLPEGWSIALVADVAHEIAPGFASGEHDSDGKGFPHMRPMNIDRSGRIDLSVVKSVPSTQDRTLLSGDILFNNTNSPDLVGKTALIGERERGFAFSNHMTRIRVGGDLSPGYVAHFLHFLWMSGYMKHRCTNHVNQASISSKSLARTVPLLIPPASEQTRIVEKLEELLSDLDAGVAELKAAQRKLAQYRQSLLKAAVEGALTADWRAARGKPQESGAELLQRILSERRARWEQKQLARFKGWQAKYPEPVAIDAADLPSLPEGWVWCSLSQVGWLDRGRSKHRPRNAPHLYGGPYPFVQTGDIRDSDTYIREASASYSEAGLAQSRLWPANTLCITIAANIGKTALLTMDACFPDSVVGFLSASSAVSVEYVEYFMRTAQQKLEEEAPATAQKNINLEILARLPVAVPPPQEQLVLVEKLSAALAAANAQQLAIEHGIKQAAAQRKNLLKSAFAGQLVSQDPNDEPASDLLARIRAERVTSDGSAPRRRRKTS